MKTYHVTIEVRVLAKNGEQAVNLLNKAAKAAMNVSVRGVSMTCDEVSDE